MGVVERKSQTMAQSNPLKDFRGIVTGTTITFPFAFVQYPYVMVSAIAESGTPETHVVSINKTGDLYTSATITNTGCDGVVWLATGIVTAVPV
jgi:hypothetical protein